IELQREAAYVAPGVGTAGLTGDGRKARQHVGASAFPEEGRPGVSRNVLGSFEYAERASAFRMRLTLGHFLAVEVRHLFEEMDVMQDDRAISTNGQRIAVADRRRAGARGGRSSRFVSSHLWNSSAQL